MSPDGHTPRVAVVETYPVPAGQESAGISMSRRETEMAGLLCSRGFDVRCFRTTRNAARSTVSDHGVDWHFVPVDPESDSAADNRITSIDLLDALRAFSPDTIFVKGVGTAMSSTLLQLGIRTRVAIIGGAYQVRELGHYHLVLAEIPSQRDYLGLRIGAHRVLEWPKFASDEFFGVQRSESPAIDIIVVGRLISLKNVSLLAGLPPNDYRVLICGDGPLRQTLESELTESGNLVEFAGQLSTSGLARALGDARLLAHPSRSEGLPRAIVEAMAAGTPAAFVAGVVDAPVLDDSNSLSAPAETFCDEVARLLEDPGRLARLSAACRTAAQREFSQERLELAVDDLARRLDALQSEDPLRRLRAWLDLQTHRLRWSLIELPSWWSLAVGRWSARLARPHRARRLYRRTIRVLKGRAGR